MSLPLAKWLRYQALFRPLAALRLPWAYAGANLVGRVDAWYRGDLNTVLNNGFRQTFPEQAADPKVLRRWRQRYCAMLARETLDTYCMDRLYHNSRRSGTTLPVRLSPNAQAVLRQTRAAANDHNKGLIVIVNHYGRVNLVLLALALAGERLGMLTGTIDERNPQLDPVERRYLRRKVYTLRRYIGGRWVCLADDLRPLYRDLCGGGTLAFALDVYNPTMSVQRVAYPFLGGQLLLSPGIARIAARTKALMLYGVARESASATWQVEVDLSPLPASPEQGLAAAVRALERDVRAAPWAWWQWGVFNQLWQPSHAAS